MAAKFRDRAIEEPSRRSLPLRRRTSPSRSRRALTVHRHQGAVAPPSRRRTSPSRSRRALTVHRHQGAVAPPSRRRTSPSRSRRALTVNRHQGAVVPFISVEAPYLAIEEPLCAHCPSPLRSRRSVHPIVPSTPPPNLFSDTSAL
jgi:hypothetical protein